MWNVVYSRQSIRDSKKIEQSNLKQTVYTDKKEIS